MLQDLLNASSCLSWVHLLKKKKKKKPNAMDVFPLNQSISCLAMYRHRVRND